MCNILMWNINANNINMCNEMTIMKSNNNINNNNKMK